MKDVKETLLDRTSIRRYEREHISDEAMSFIFDAIRNTPTSYNGQQYSVLDISDQSLKEQLYEITGQKQLKTCDRLLIFCSDFHKMEILARSKGLEMPAVTDTMDGVLLGTIDASLAMMSAIVAAESMDLGTNCVGYLRTADPEKIGQLLNIPKGVFVVCGLAIGVPREHPDLKPKQPREVVFHKNGYSVDDEQLVADLNKYDAEVKQYNATRSGGTTDNDWCSHILDYYSYVPKYHILDYLKEQGYDVKK